MTQREEFALKYGQHSCTTVHFDNYGTPYVGAIECLMANTMVQAAWWGWKAAKAQAVPKWIPVSERLPPVGELGSSNEYIVYETLNNKVQHDYFIITDDEHPPFWNYYDNHVTHWMPLPSAPEQNK